MTAASAPAGSGLAAAITPWLADRLGARDVALADIHRHAEGFSWQTWTFTARWRAGGREHERGLALRREPEDGLLAPYDTAAQYRLHAALVEHSTVPVPGLLGLETDPSVLGMPFYVMDRVEGRVPVQWRGRRPADLPGRGDPHPDRVRVRRRPRRGPRHRPAGRRPGLPRGSPLRRRHRGPRDRPVGALLHPVRTGRGAAAAGGVRLAATAPQHLRTGHALPRRLPDRQRDDPRDRGGRGVRLGAGPPR